jgi:hypothetical protein
MQALFVLLFAGIAILSWANLQLVPQKFTGITVTSVAIALILTLLSSVFSAVLAVVVHRFVINGETNGVTDLPSLGPVIAEFWAVILLINLSNAALGALGYLLSSAGSLILTVLLIGLPWVAAIYLLLRIFLIFPAIAVEASGRSLRSAYEQGRGLVWKGLASSILAEIPLIVASLIVASLFGPFSPVGLIVLAALNMFMMAAIVAIASHLYAWRQEQPASPRI